MNIQKRFPHRFRQQAHFVERSLFAVLLLL